jgi:glycosyltransferase involved in cell wall biosynthesis
LHYAATVHHGIDTRSFAIDAAPGDHLLYFGRIHPDKGTAEAIEVARRTGRRLDIGGIIQDEAYFHTEVEPHLDGELVRFLGPVDASSRASVRFGQRHRDLTELISGAASSATSCTTSRGAHSSSTAPRSAARGASSRLAKISVRENRRCSSPPSRSNPGKRGAPHL